MGDNQSQTVDEEVSEWEEYEDYGVEVRVMVYSDHNPLLCAVFDGDERVTEPTATLQIEEQIWAAKGYRNAKKKYDVSVEELGK